MQIVLEKFSFSIVNLPSYCLRIILISLSMRIFLTLFKVAAIRQGEADDEDGKVSFKSLGRWQAYWRLFFSWGHSINTDDYWLPSIVGSIELFSYPILLFNNNFGYIGAWLGLKTAVQWLRWGKSRTPFNRYLLGNMLVILFSFYLVKFVSKAILNT